MEKHSPIYRDRHQCEARAGDRKDRNEVGDLAVGPAEHPVTVEHIDEVKDDVAAADEDIRDAEVHDEHVRDGSHLFVEQHDQNHTGVAEKCDDHHQTEQADPAQFLPDFLRITLFAADHVGYISDLADRLIVVEEQSVVQ